MVTYSNNKIKVLWQNMATNSLHFMVRCSQGNEERTFQIYHTHKRKHGGLEILWNSKSWRVIANGIVLFLWLGFLWVVGISFTCYKEMIEQQKQPARFKFLAYCRLSVIAVVQKYFNSYFKYQRWEISKILKNLINMQ